MPTIIRIGLIGDYDADFLPHQATVGALDHAAEHLNVIVDPTWIPTAALDPFAPSSVHDFDALWCTPGSPFQSMQGALNAIRFARERDRPFLGTCAGFQHLVIEYARNVLGSMDAQHAEYLPVDGTLFITPLACAIAGTTLNVMVEPTSRAGRAYQQVKVQEQYYCTFGLNPAYQAELHAQGLRVVGVDEDGEARILELPYHPFFVGTLFVPQMLSRPERPHPLVTAYVEAAVHFHDRINRNLAVEGASQAKTRFVGTLHFTG